MLPNKQTLGFSKAIWFCVALSKQFILDLFNDIPTEKDEFVEKEAQVENLADWLSDYLIQHGYSAHSQSEKNNRASGYIEQAYYSKELQQGISVLSSKAIARISGLGFIGKYNLFVTEEFVCGFAMCSVLTDAPIIVVADNKTEIISKCENCSVCKNVCVGKAIKGNMWTLEGGRESVIDVKSVAVH